MLVHSLNVKPFKPKEDKKEAFGLEIPYLSFIEALIYLTSNYIRPDFVFAMNFLTRHSFSRSQTSHVFTYDGTPIS